MTLWKRQESCWVWRKTTWWTESKNGTDGKELHHIESCWQWTNRGKLTHGRAFHAQRIKPIITAARLRVQGPLRRSRRKGNEFFWSDFCDRLLAARRRTACAVRSSQPLQSEKTMKLNCHYRPTNTLPVPFSCTANGHSNRIEVV